MKTLYPRLALFSLTIAAATAPVSAFAAGDASGSERDVVPTVLWSLVGVIAFAIVLGIFYALKRGVGAFPKNPTWVAPISIRPSSDFPGDTESPRGHIPCRRQGGGSSALD
ncbi:MAG: hypothetical protein LC118_01840 [Dehalococcoidia bacterium]|nr:hypothetical protein [Dehalococcoidia bacterium]